MPYFVPDSASMFILITSEPELRCFQGLACSETRPQIAVHTADSLPELNCTASCSKRTNETVSINYVMMPPILLSNQHCISSGKTMSQRSLSLGNCYHSVAAALHAFVS